MIVFGCLLASPARRHCLLVSHCALPQDKIKAYRHFFITKFRKHEKFAWHILKKQISVD